MKRLLFTLPLLLLASCTRTIYVFPDPPPPVPKLDEDLTKPCPALPQLTDKSVYTLYKADKAAAYEYARCKAKNAALRDVYTVFFTEYNNYIKAYEKAKKDAKK